MPLGNHSSQQPDAEALQRDSSRSSLLSRIDFLFDKRPIVDGEKADEYDNLLETIHDRVGPIDFIEELWVKDVVDLLWDARRYRRWRDSILVQARYAAAVKCAFTALMNDMSHLESEDVYQAQAEDLASGWVRGDDEKALKLDFLIMGLGLTLSDLIAQGFLLKLTEVERIERMIASANQRRDVLLREIIRKRAVLGQQLQAAANENDDEPPRPMWVSGPASSNASPIPPAK